MTATEGATISAKLGTRGPVDLTEDKFLVVRVTEDDLTEDLVVEATKGETTTTKTFSLASLVLEEQQAEE